MPAYVNAADFLIIGIMSFVFIWGANRILKKTGLSQYALNGN